MKKTPIKYEMWVKTTFGNLAPNQIFVRQRDECSENSAEQGAWMIKLPEGCSVLPVGGITAFCPSPNSENQYTHRRACWISDDTEVFRLSTSAAPYETRVPTVWVSPDQTRAIVIDSKAEIVQEFNVNHQLEPY